MTDHTTSAAISAAIPEESKEAAVALCAVCGAETDVARLPMEMSAFAETLLAATCQGCGRGADVLRLRAGRPLRTD